jgi:hypothetical protein
VIGNLRRLYNPRTDKWEEHFRFEGAVIEPLTDVAEATVRLLRINTVERVQERASLKSLGRIPRS